MHSNLNKMWLMTAASLVAVTSYVNADSESAQALVAASSYSNADSAQMRNLEKRVNTLEQTKGTGGMINPNGRPNVADGYDLFITADALLWQAHEGGLGFAVESDQNSAATPLDHSSVENPHFEYEWGFRLGVGYNMKHDGWDLYGNWTHIDMESHHEEEGVDSDDFLWPVWIHPASPFAGYSVNEAEAHWKMHLNIADLDLGREFFTSKWLTLRPHVGLRSAWIKQRYDVDYEEFYNSSNVLSANEVDVDMRNNYWGLGPKFGIDTQWGLGSGWSIFGDASFSLLYGFFHTYFHELDRGLNNIGVPYAAVNNSYRQSVAITDLQLGLRWDHMFDKDHYHFGLQAGWEHHMFFSQNQMTRFVDNAEKGNFLQNQGDLTTQGWTLSARFDF